MATLLAHVQVIEGMEDHWEEIARTVFAATHENEPACRSYEYWRGSAPGSYYVLLSFDDFDGFMTHQVADYHHNAGFGDCFAGFKLEFIDPVDGASELPRTATSGAHQPDKGELWNEYVDKHSEETPSWWAKMRR
ncbi:MAG: putative quinol monooxygenase [Acidimicrobiales bacterium]